MGKDSIMQAAPGKKSTGCAKLALGGLLGALCLCGLVILSVGSFVEGWPDTLFVRLVPTFPGKVINDKTYYDFYGGYAERLLAISPADPTSVFTFYKQTLSSGNYALKDSRLYYEDSKLMNYCLAFRFSLLGGVV